MNIFYSSSFSLVSLRLGDRKYWKLHSSHYFFNISRYIYAHILFFFDFQMNYIFICFFIFLFLIEGKGVIKKGNKKSLWERNIYWLPSSHAPTGDWTSNPAMCPDWQLNWWPLVCGTWPRQLSHTSWAMFLIVLRALLCYHDLEREHLWVTFRL